MRRGSHPRGRDERKGTMQLGMIGLGRMGEHGSPADRRRSRMRRLRHVAEGGGGARQGERDRRVVARRLRRKARETPRDLADGARRPSSTSRSPTSFRSSRQGDILIDGGNSYYIDDIRRAKELAAEGNPLRRRRDERRRLGPRAGLLHDDRRRGRRREAPRPDLQAARPGPRATSRGRPGARRRTAPPRRATSTAGRTAPATSSRWSTTASSTASWPPTPRDSTS